MQLIQSNKFALIGVAVAGLALFVLLKKKDAAAGAGAALGQAAVKLAGGAISGATTGVAYGIGDALGVPRTNMTECERAIAEGRYWDASFACPASDFLGALNPLDMVTGAAGSASDAVGNAVQSAGAVIGIPRTSMTECERAKAEGRTLDASFACGAGDFFSYINPFK